MSDDKDCTLLKVIPELFLNHVIRFKVNVGRGFVQHHNLTLLENSSRKAHKLFLSDREQIVAFTHNCVCLIV